MSGVVAARASSTGSVTAQRRILIDKLTPECAVEFVEWCLGQPYKFCAHCGEAFTAGRRTHAVTCSDRCRQARHRELRRLSAKLGCSVPWLSTLSVICEFGQDHLLTEKAIRIRDNGSVYVGERWSDV